MYTYFSRYIYGFALRNYIYIYMYIWIIIEFEMLSLWIGLPNTGYRGIDFLVQLSDHNYRYFATDFQFEGGK